MNNKNNRLEKHRRRRNKQYIQYNQTMIITRTNMTMITIILIKEAEIELGSSNASLIMCEPGILSIFGAEGLTEGDILLESKKRKISRVSSLFTGLLALFILLLRSIRCAVMPVGFGRATRVLFFFLMMLIR